MLVLAGGRTSEVESTGDFDGDERKREERGKKRGKEGKGPGVEGAESVTSKRPQR